jgi:hypothetical protein
VVYGLMSNLTGKLTRVSIFDEVALVCSKRCIR